MVKMAMAMLCLHAAFQFHESLTQWTLDILEAGEFLTLPRPLRGIRYTVCYSLNSACISMDFDRCYLSS